MYVKHKHDPHNVTLHSLVPFEWSQSSDVKEESNPDPLKLNDNPAMALSFSQAYDIESAALFKMQKVSRLWA